MLEDIKSALINNDNIVPVIGFELLTIRDSDGKNIPYLDYFTQYINQEENLNLKREENVFNFFNNVGHALLDKYRNKLEVIKSISKYAIKIHNKVDTSYLEKIVSILPFNYFINLTFTTHLIEVIGFKRSFPNTPVKHSMFPFLLKSPKKPDDIIKSGCEFEGVIYNLSGLAYKKIDNDYVGLHNYFYSDDDFLEFIPEFNRRYEIDLINYKEIVSQSSLLFLGCQYPDWLTRILIHTLKPGSLRLNDNLQARIIIDYCNDNSNSFFLDRHKFKFQQNDQTTDLVDKLYDLLLKTPGERLITDINHQGFVFISYTRDNLTLVKKIVCQLASKMNIWFDRIKMFPGDKINEEVKLGIKNCSCFLPIITLESINKTKQQYVRQEWQFYKDEFRTTPKVIPLVSNKVNVGTLGFNLDQEFAQSNNNIFYIQIDDNGLNESDIASIKNRL